MDVLAEYRRRAVECERLAEQAITDEHWQAILGIAATWRALAEQRERLELPGDNHLPSPKGRQPVSADQRPAAEADRVAGSGSAPGVPLSVAARKDRAA